MAPLDSLSVGTSSALGAGLRRERRRFFAYRTRADLVRKTALALSFAALTGIAAQVRVPLPFSPVPVTGQTFAVLLCGIALGREFGGLSQVLYAAIGAAGVPWFSGMAGGVGVILGPTGGYLLGFVLAAAFVGWVTDRWVSARQYRWLVVVLAVANFGAIHLLGMVGLVVWITVTTGSAPTFVSVATMGSLPFVPGDVVKLLAAAAVGTAVMPKRPYAEDVGKAGNREEN